MPHPLARHGPGGARRGLPGGRRHRAASGGWALRRRAGDRGGGRDRHGGRRPPRRGGRRRGRGPARRPSQGARHGRGGPSPGRGGVLLGGGRRPPGEAAGGGGQIVDVQACAPLRISFAGGGTDVPPYPATNGGAVLSAAFARHELVFNGHLDLVKAVLRDLAPERGLDLTLATDAPPGSGLGSSSALVVAWLAAAAGRPRSWPGARTRWSGWT